LFLYFYRAAIELRNEAKSHKLNHLNIVKLYAMVFEPNHYGVLMEYVPHGGLDEYIFQNKVRCEYYRCIHRYKNKLVYLSGDLGMLFLTL